MSERSAESGRRLPLRSIAPMAAIAGPATYRRVPHLAAPLPSAAGSSKPAKGGAKAEHTLRRWLPTDREVQDLWGGTRNWLVEAGRTSSAPALPRGRNCSWCAAALSGDRLYKICALQNPQAASSAGRQPGQALHPHRHSPIPSSVPSCPSGPPLQKTWPSSCQFAASPPGWHRSRRHPRHSRRPPPLPPPAPSRPRSRWMRRCRPFRR